MIAYFDCFAGVSGNMVLGAFIDAGMDEKQFQELLGTLPVDGYSIKMDRVVKKGIEAQYIDVVVTDDQHHRHLSHIVEIINNSSFPEEVKELAIKIFTRLATAEAKVHGTTVDHVHFHEVGAVDAIVDILGAAYGVYSLGITEVYASALNVGHGLVECAHGLMPIPAPATQELLIGATTYSNQVKGELVTPTGAAIITTLTDRFGPQPEFSPAKIGYGAGTWDLEVANVLRLILAEKKNTNRAILLEANIDDLNPEIYDYVMEKVLEAGAKDVFLTNVQMKKNRPGILLTVLVEDESKVETMEKIIFRETSTIGIRRQVVERRKLERQEKMIATCFGDVAVKEAYLDGERVNVKAESDQCKMIAREQEIALRKVYEQVYQALGDENWG